MESGSGAGGGDLEMGGVFAVPDSSDWYLTTDDSVTLGPYWSYQEAVSLLSLLRDQAERGLPKKASRAV